jgi:hypothetical protein
MPCKVGAVLQVIRLLAVAAIQLLPCGTTAPPNAKDKVFRYRSYSHLEEFGDPDPVVLKRIRGTHAINIHQSRIPSVTITYYHYLLLMPQFVGANNRSQDNAVVFFWIPLFGVDADDCLVQRRNQ